MLLFMVIKSKGKVTLGDKRKEGEKNKSRSHDRYPSMFCCAPEDNKATETRKKRTRHKPPQQRLTNCGKSDSH